MKIAISVSSTNAYTRWMQALQSLLPQAQFFQYQLGQDCPKADYAVVRSPCQAFIDSQTQLKAMFNGGAGVDALLKLTHPPACPIVRIEDAGMGPQMVQYIAHAALRFFRQFELYEYQQRQSIWQPQHPRRIDEYPVGILGFGVLAQPVTTALQMLGFKVHAWTRSPRADAPIKLFSGAEQLPSFLQRTRILVCMLPLTPQTQHILNADTLSQLQPDACLINVGRGAHVHEQSLLDALASGQLAEATLDVFEHEPLPPTHPFWQHPRIHITPHISAETLIEDSAKQIVAKIKAIEQGQPISGIVDLARGY